MQRVFRSFLPLLFALTALLPWLFPAPRVSAAPAQEGVDLRFFYDNLADQGDWYQTTDYGYVWQPRVAVKNTAWRPYTEGFWAQTELGWTWVSEEPFGWAAYHYGRWTRLKDVGWAWVPGSEWSPGWVSWRVEKEDAAPLASIKTRGVPLEEPPLPLTGAPAPAAPPPNAAAREAYIGWAPLPPEAVLNGAGGALGPDVERDYGIEPADYAFVRTRDFGAPRLSEVLVEPSRNVGIIERTVNVTRIAPGRGGSITVAGPEYDRLSLDAARPVPRLALRRQANLGPAQQAIAAGHSNEVRGRALEIAGPRFVAAAGRGQPAPAAFDLPGARKAELARAPKGRVATAPPAPLPREERRLAPVPPVAAPPAPEAEAPAVISRGRGRRGSRSRAAAPAVATRERGKVAKGAGKARAARSAAPARGGGGREAVKKGGGGGKKAGGGAGKKGGGGGGAKKEGGKKKQR